MFKSHVEKHALRNKQLASPIITERLVTFQESCVEIIKDETPEDLEGLVLIYSIRNRGATGVFVDGSSRALGKDTTTHYAKLLPTFIPILRGKLMDPDCMHEVFSKGRENYVRFKNKRLILTAKVNAKHRPIVWAMCDKNSKKDKI